MLNVSLLPATDQGAPSWRLISDTGEEVAPFTTFTNALLSQHLSFRTRKTYSERAAHFIDYLFEAAKVLGSAPSRAQLYDLVTGYPAVLKYGTQASEGLPRKVAERLGYEPLSASFRNQSYAALEMFLRLSEHKRQLHAALGREVDKTALFSPPQRLTLPKNQRTALIANSMLAGCIAGGPKMIEKHLFSGHYRAADPEDWPNKAFPYDRVVDLITTPKSYRDRALYALLAASGVRISEALQVCLTDIDASAGTVRIMDPKNRPAGFYKGLTQQEVEKLHYKGRKTSRTFLIAPFDELFWRYVQLYMDSEYVDSCSPFLFQKARRSNQPLPLALARYSSTWEQFKKYAGKIGCASYSPHSLRHMYGTYLVNYAPNNEGGYGLKLPIVSLFMGHKTLRNTERYALVDRGVAHDAITFANASIYDGVDGKSSHQLKIEIAEKNLARLRSMENALQPDRLLEGEA